MRARGSRWRFTSMATPATGSDSFITSMWNTWWDQRLKLRAIIANRLASQNNPQLWFDLGRDWRSAPIVRWMQCDTHPRLLDKPLGHVGRSRLIAKLRRKGRTNFLLSCRWFNWRNDVWSSMIIIRALFTYMCLSFKIQKWSGAMQWQGRNFLNRWNRCQQDQKLFNCVWLPYRQS